MSDISQFWDTILSSSQTRAQLTADERYHIVAKYSLREAQQASMQWLWRRCDWETFQALQPVIDHMLTRGLHGGEADHGIVN